MSRLIAGLPKDDRRAYERMWSSTSAPRWGLGERPAVLVVDMLNAFIDPQFSSSVGAFGASCVKHVGELLDAARPAGVPVIYLTTPSVPKTAEIGAWARGRPPEEIVPFNMEGEANEIVSELRPTPNDVVLRKAKPSAFFGTQLVSVLNHLGADSVVVAGATTSGCVRATVVDAFSYNYRVVVPVDAVADRSEFSHRVELLHMGTRYADLIEVADLVTAWTDCAADSV